MPAEFAQGDPKRNGYKRVHIVEQAPKPDAIDHSTTPDANVTMSPHR